MREFIDLNRPIIWFVYGQVFFVLGLAIAWQSRRHSRLGLARSLAWLGAFGLAHGLHEWGDIFIPIQAEYLGQIWIDLLMTAQVILLAASFTFLFQFGAVLLSSLDSRLRWLLAVPGTLFIIWMVVFLWASEVWRQESIDLVTSGSIWARYLLGFTGALVAAVGLWRQTRQRAQVPGFGSIWRNFSIASLALVAYALLAGLIGPPAPFFPANILNAAVMQQFLGVPVQVFRSLIGLILLISILRGLQVFDAEVDRRIEDMESAQILMAERERISRELHDGAIQTVYSAGLVAESVRKRMAHDDPLAARVDRVVTSLQHAIRDLRQFIVQLEPDVTTVNLMDDLRQLAADPYLQSLGEVSMIVRCPEDVPFSPSRAAHVLAVVNEALSNVARHARARRVWIVADRDDDCLVVTIADDGVGIADSSGKRGFGLRNMRDRARLLNGTLSIEPRNARGTLVTLRVPWEEIA